MTNLRTHARRTALVAGLAATIGGQAAIRSGTAEPVATLTFLVGAGLCAIALRDRSDEIGAPDAPPAATLRRSAASLIALGILAAITASVFLVRDWKRFFYLDWSLLTLAIALWSWGLSALTPTGQPRRAWSTGERIGLLLVFAVSVGLRFYRFGVFPDGYTTHAIEEQQTGLGAYSILHQGFRPWEFFVDYQLTALAMWFDTLPNFSTIRVPFVTASALTVLPAHFLFRQLVRPTAAVAASFLYAALSWNLIYSRCAHPIFLNNLFVVTVFALLVHYGRTRRFTVLPWIGFLSGLTLYSYAGYRGTPAFAGIFLGGTWLTDLWRAWIARPTAAAGTTVWKLVRSSAAVACFLLALGITAAPLVPHLSNGPRNYYFEAAERALANRAYYTDDSAEFWRQRVDRMQAVGRIFFHVGDDSPTFNFPGEPMLDPVIGSLAVIGLFVMLLSPRRRYHAFFLFVAAALLLVGTVFVQNLDVRRLQGLTILIVLAAAHAIDGILAFAGSARFARRAALAGITAACGFVLWHSYDLYYVKMAGHPGVRRAFKDYYTTLIRFGHERGQDRSILLSSIIHRLFESGWHYRHNYSWLLDQAVSGRNLRDLNELLPPNLIPPGAQPQTVIIQSPFEREAAGVLLEAVYPGVKCEEFLESDNPWVSMTACDLPEALVARPLQWRLSARYWGNAERSGKPFLERNEPFIGYATVPFDCYNPRPGQSCSADWEGTFDVPDGTAHQLVTESIGRTVYSVELDGHAVDTKQPLPIRSGRHSLHVSAVLPRDWETGVRVSLSAGGAARVIHFVDPER